MDDQEIEALSREIRKEFINFKSINGRYVLTDKSDNIKIWKKAAKLCDFFYLKPKEEYKNFLCAKTVGILSALAFVVVFFYTYTGIIGTNFAILDIGIFFVGVFLGEYIAYKLTYQMSGCKDGLAAFILIVLFICFIVFTYNAPQIGLFRDPLINITK